MEGQQISLFIYLTPVAALLLGKLDSNPCSALEVHAHIDHSELTFSPIKPTSRFPTPPFHLL